MPASGMNAADAHELHAFEPGQSRAAAQQTLAAAFTRIGIDSAALDARILLCAALGIDHVSLIRDPDLLLGTAAARVNDYAIRRMQHEPVSRILGYREFFGETYAITNAVLDPRPDTECLVEAVVEAVQSRRDQALRILDLGVGSGAILGALLGQLKNATGIGIDISPAAAVCARANLSALGYAGRASFAVSNWMTAVSSRFDIIVSNPPYIESAVIDRLDPAVRLHDPHLALDGGADGLDAYRTILPSVVPQLADDSVLALELGAGQFAPVEKIIRSAGLEPYGTRCDLAGRTRVVLARLKSRFCISNS